MSISVGITGATLKAVVGMWAGAPAILEPPQRPARGSAVRKSEKNPSDPAVSEITSLTLNLERMTTVDTIPNSEALKKRLITIEVEFSSAICANRLAAAYRRREDAPPKTRART